MFPLEPLRAFNRFQPTERGCWSGFLPTKLSVFVREQDGCDRPVDLRDDEDLPPVDVVDAEQGVNQLPVLLGLQRLVILLLGLLAGVPPIAEAVPCETLLHGLEEPMIKHHRPGDAVGGDDLSGPEQSHSHRLLREVVDGHGRVRDRRPDPGQIVP